MKHCIYIISFVLVAFGLISKEVEATNSPVISTWRGGIHILPASATRSGNFEDAAFEDGETLQQWSNRLTKEIVKPGVKVPAVIYLHGCLGPRMARAWAYDFKDRNYPLDLRDPRPYIKGREGSNDHNF